MSRKRLPRTLIVGTCKPGKEFRASEELMDILMHYDPSVSVVEYGKGLVVGTSSLEPRDLVNLLRGKVTAYLNRILVGNETCEGCKALRKGCVIEVPEGREAVCVGKALVKLEFELSVRNGIIVFSQG